jgi:hypothetical protein
MQKNLPPISNNTLPEEKNSPTAIGFHLFGRPPTAFQAWAITALSSFDRIAFASLQGSTSIPVTILFLITA